MRTQAQAEDLLRAGGRAAVLHASGELASDWAQRAARHDLDGTFAAENMAGAWAAGLGNLTLPIDRGGVGGDLGTATRALRILGAGDPSSALVLAMHMLALVAATIPGSDWPRPVAERVIASSLQGPALANHLRVEPDLGTPARGGLPATRARAIEDGWEITGQKLYCTGSVGLRWLLVWAGTVTPDGALAGSFLVPSDAPGVSIIETWDHLGMRATASHDIVLDRVFVPADHACILVPVSDGPPASDPVLRAWISLLVVAVYVGVADAALDWLIGWLWERTPSNLGAPLATLPRLQTAVGEIEASLLTAGALIESVADAVDTGGEAAAVAASRAGLCKAIASHAAINAVQDAVAIAGNHALSRRNPLERHLRDVICSRIHTPQDDSVMLAAGRAALDDDGPR